MKNIEYVFICMGFIAAGLSLIMSYKQGFDAWIWQLNCMIWATAGFAQQIRIDILTNKLKK